MIPGAKAFAVHGGKILMILRDDDPGIRNPGCWCLPGGGIEPGESPCAAMAREFREELGLLPRDMVYLGRHERSGEPVVWRNLIRLTDAEASELKSGHEGQRFDFFAADTLPSLRTASRLHRYLIEILPALAVLAGGPRPLPPRGSD